MQFQSASLQSLGFEADEPLLRAEQWLQQRPNCAVSKRMLGAADEDPIHADTRALQQQLLEESPSKYDARRQLLALHKLINAGNVAGHWDICPPGIPIEVKPPMSPYTDDCRWVTRAMRAVDHALCGEGLERISMRAQGLRDSGEDIDDPSRHATHRSLEPHLLGLLLVSVTLRSGVCNPAGIRALLNHLAEPTQQVPNRCSWRDLRLAYQSQQDAERHRVHLDLISELLLANARKHPDSDLNKLADEGWPAEALWRKMSAALVALQVKPAQARHFTGWLDAVQFYWSVNSTYVVGALMRGRHIAHALKPSAWARIQQVEDFEPDASEQPAVKERRESDENFEEEIALPDGLQVAWLDAAVSAASGGNKRAVRKVLEQHAAQASSSHSAAALIPRWGAYLITSGGISGQALEISTAKKYMGSAGRRIAMLVGSEDLVELGPEGLCRVYEEVLDDAVSIGNRKFLARALVSFHQFLVSDYGVAEIDTREVLGIGGQRSPVDANVITLDEFLKIRKRIETDPELLAYGSDYVEIAWLMLTLGFRCGFRRMEALSLRIADLHRSDRPELLIRPWANRRLKSKNSTRKCPLWALLDASELARLESWLKHRKSKPHGKDSLLFAVPTGPKAAISQSFLIPKIHGAMRAGTGDKTLRFHMLRHSFCSWALLRLMMGRKPFELELYFAKHPQTCAWVREDAPRFAKRLINAGRTTRKSVYAISSLMGHSNVRITLEHYFHFGGIVIAECGKQFANQPSAAALRTAGGIAVSTSYRLFNTSDKLDQPINKWLVRSGHAVNCHPRKHTADRVAHSQSKDAESNLAVSLDQWRAFLIQMGRHRVDDLPMVARIHGLPAREAEAVRGRAVWLSRLQSQQPGARRHPVIVEEGKRVLAPPAASRQQDQRSFERLAASLETVIHQAGRPFAGFTPLQVNYIWAHLSWKSRAYLTFTPRDVKLARAYWLFLCALGLGQEEIEVLSHDKVTQARTREINKAIGRPHRWPVLSRHPNNPMSGVSVGSVSIRPVLGESEERDSIRSWRLLMYLSVCVFGTQEVIGLVESHE